MLVYRRDVCTRSPVVCASAPTSTPHMLTLLLWKLVLCYGYGLPVLANNRKQVSAPYPTDCTGNVQYFIRMKTSWSVHFYVCMHAYSFSWLLFSLHWLQSNIEILLWALACLALSIVMNWYAHMEAQISPLCRIFQIVQDVLTSLFCGNFQRFRFPGTRGHP
jgi:hypothetical protein